MKPANELNAAKRKPNIDNTKPSVSSFFDDLTRPMTAIGIPMIGIIQATRDNPPKTEPELSFCTKCCSLIFCSFV